MTDEKLPALRRQAKYPNLLAGHDGRFSTIHGLYRKELSDEEQDIAKALVDDWRAKYDLDDGVDLAMAYEAAVNFLKARRAARGAEQEEKDHNVKDYKAQHARLFREFIESLGLNRKNRKDAGAGDAALAAINAIVKKREEPRVIDVEPKEARE